MAFETRTWFCCFQYYLLGNPPQEIHEIQSKPSDALLFVRVHDPEGFLDNQLRESGLQVLCVSTAMSYAIEQEPVPQVFYERGIHISSRRLSRFRRKQFGLDKKDVALNIREKELLYTAVVSKLFPIMNALAIYLWNTGAKEIAEEAAKRTAAKSA